MNKKNRYIPIICMLITVIFWGYSFISTKIVLKEMPPISIAFFRQIIAAVPLLIILLLTGQLRAIKLKHIGLLAVSGFFGIVLYSTLENTGLQFTSASNASMIVATVPVFTLITESLFYKLKISIKMLVCILASIFGVYLVISSNGNLDFSSKSFLGNILVMGAMISWVVYTLVIKRLSGKYPSIMVTTYQTLICIFIFIPFIISETKDWKMISLEPLLNLIFLGVFCSAAAYFCFIYASKNLGASVSSAFLNLIPVVSVISGYLILGEKLSGIQFVGMILIILSLLFLNLKLKKK